MHVRKISVGADYKSAMHYLVGQGVLGGDYIIHLIQKTDDSWKIWIEGNGEVLLWKEFSSQMPASIEYNIDF
jgi:hypothetical protein